MIIGTSVREKRLGVRSVLWTWCGVRSGAFLPKGREENTKEPKSCCPAGFFFWWMGGSQKVESPVFSPWGWGKLGRVSGTGCEPFLISSVQSPAGQDEHRHDQCIFITPSIPRTTHYEPCNLSSHSAGLQTELAASFLAGLLDY